MSNITKSPFDVDADEAREIAEREWDESTCNIFYGNVPPTQFRENVDPNSGLRVYKSVSQYERQNGPLVNTRRNDEELDDRHGKDQPEMNDDSEEEELIVLPTTITTTVQPTAATQLTMASYEMESNNDDIIPDCTSMKRWPQCPKLVRNDPALVLKILKAADDCAVTGEVKADNNDNVKGNKWAKLYDACHGGSRGLLVAYLSKPKTASKFKTCITEIWKQCRRVKDLGDKFHDKEMLNIGVRQLKEYNNTVEKKKANTANKSKERTAIKQKEMITYERKMGALPPGAKGKKGAGRTDHSTNLRLGKPATCAHANSDTVDLAGDDADDDSVVAGERTPKRHRGTRSKSPSTGTSRSTITAGTNANALNEVTGLGTTLNRLVDRLPENSAAKSKVSVMTEEDIAKRNLLDLKAEYAKTIELFGPIAGTSENAKKRYETAITKCGDVEDRLDALLRPIDNAEKKKDGYDSDGSSTVDPKKI